MQFNPTACLNTLTELSQSMGIGIIIGAFLTWLVQKFD